MADSCSTGEMILGVVCRRHLDSLFEAAYAVDASRRIVYWNAAAERLTGFPAGEVVGSGCGDGVLVHVDESGRPMCDGFCPACEAMYSDTVTEAEVYLRHRAGHRVRVAMRTVPVSEGGAPCGAIEYFYEVRDSAAARQRLERLEKLAMTDPLTGVGNRRHGQDLLSSARSSLSRYGWSFGLAMLDIDGFKAVNDAFGHQAGDAVLRVVAGSLVSTLRPSDALCRWGGDEFLAVIQGAGEAELSAACGRMCSVVASSAARLDGISINVSISAGATVCRPGETARVLLARADGLLYEAKKSGKNTFRVG